MGQVFKSCVEIYINGFLLLNNDLIIPKCGTIILTFALKTAMVRMSQFGNSFVGFVEKSFLLC